MPQYLSPGVYVEEVEAGSRPIEGVGTSVAAFVGLAQRGPFNQPVQVTNWSQFAQTFGDFMEGSYLAHSIYGYFLNGGGTCFVVRIGANGATPAARAELQLGKDKALPYRITALESGPGGNDITVEVADASEPGDDTFKLIVKRGGKEEEVYDNVTTRKGRRNVITAVKAQSKLIQIEEIQGATAMEPVAHTALAGGGASAPVRVTPEAYVGNSSDRTGFGGLEAIDTVTMLAVPDLMAAYQGGVIDLEGLQAVQLAMIAHCELMGDRVAILDAPPGLNAQQVREWRVDKAKYDSKYATLYYPWLKVFDPLAGQMTLVPPSGHIAGIWARSDDSRGVHKAPAGFERPRMEVPERSPALQLPRGLDPRRHAVGRLRAERHGPVGAGQADDQLLPGARLARRRPLRLDAAGGLLCQVRRGNQPRRRDRCGKADSRDRHRAGEARRVRRLPHRPVLGRRITDRIGGSRKCQPVYQDLRLTHSRDTTSRSRSTASRWPSSRR